MVEDIDRAVEAVGKNQADQRRRLSLLNSNKGLSIGIWPRITSGFTSNCSAGYLLKLQPRFGSCERAEARLFKGWRLTVVQVC
jgi:hypothetical protein